MAWRGDGNAYRLWNNFPAIGTGEFTTCFWYRYITGGTYQSFGRFFTTLGPTSGTSFVFIWGPDSDGENMRFYCGGTSVAVWTPTKEVWHKGVARRNSSNLIEVWEDNVFKGSSTVSNNLSETEISVGASTIGDNTLTDGYALASSTVWNAALTDAEIEALSDGISPALIRPQSITFNCPCIRNMNYNSVLGEPSTIVGTPNVYEHPRIY